MIYSTDVKENPNSPATATTSKASYSTTSVGWASDYSNYLQTTGSSGYYQLGFDPVIDLTAYEDVKIKIYWGATSNRPLQITINGGTAKKIDEVTTSSDRSKVREVEAELSVNSLTSIKFNSSGGGNVFLFRIEIVGTSTSSGGADPVDPTFTYTPTTYTIGDPALDLSTKLTSNSGGAISFAVSTADAGTTGASIANGKDFTATTAGTATITVTQAETTGYNAKTQDIAVSVVEPDPCTTYYHFVATDDATANSKTNWSGFTNAPTGSKNQDNSVTIDGTTYTLKKRTDSTGKESTILGFTIPAGKVGTLYGYMKSSGSTGRTLSLKKDDDVIKTNTEITGSSWTLITIDAIAPGTYTLSPDQNVQVQMFVLKICDATFHTITFNSNGGSTVADLSVLDGTTAIQPTDPERGKYTFLGWYNGETLYDWATPVASNLTLTAKWQDPWSITFDSNGGSAIEPITVKHNTKAEKPTDPTKDANDFLGWFYGDPAVEFDWDANVTQNYALVAHWQPAVAKYDVEYYDGETKIGTEEQVWANQHPTAAGIETAKPLYTFVGWYLTSALEGDPVTLNTVTPVEGLKLYGKWTKAYATSYDMETYAVSDGASLATLLENLTTAGYAYTNVNGIDNGHTHNYIYDGMKYKTNDGDLSFNVNAGKLVIVKTGHLPANALTMYINGVADPTVFVGANEAVETHVNNYFYSATEALYRLDIQASKGTCAIKAVTITDPYTVSFAAHGDADPADLQGTPSVTLPTPTNSSASFLGWFDAETGGNKIGEAGETYTPTADITLHAQWEAQSTINTLSDLKVNGETVLGFAADKQTYRMVLPYKSALPMITSATPTNANATVALWPVDGPEWTDKYDGGCYRQQVVVTPQDPTAEKGYYDIRITYAPKDGACIFKATLTGEKAATYEGIFADGTNSAINLKADGDNGYKFAGKENYIKMALTGGTFAEGDILHMTYKTAPQQGELAIYNNTTKIVGTANTNSTLEFPVGAAGLSTLYIRRTEDNNFNGWVSVVEVTRIMKPMLTAITFAGVSGEIDEAHKKVTVKLPYSSNVASMVVEPTIAWNAPATTNSIVVNDGNWVVGDNTYVLTDKDGDQTTYTITLTQAAASADATLKTLTINGNALTLVDGVYEYDYELPYGTTTDPTVVAEANDANVKAKETSVSLTKAVITVTAEDGTTEQEYVINFTVSRAISYVIYDGSVQESIEKSGTGLINWSLTNPSDTKGEKAEVTCNDKYYTKCVKVFSSATTKTDRYMTIEVPTGYMAKFYLAGATNSKGNERSLFISKEITGTLDQSIAYSTSSTYEGAAMMSDYQMPGTYYLCSDASIRLYELSVVLYPIDYERPVRQGYYGTICLPNKGQMIGAAVYEIAYMDYKDGAPYKIYFDEILNGKMEAGVPYVFLPNEGYNQLIVTYTAIIDAPAAEVKGLCGFIGASATDEYQIPGGKGNYIIQNNQYREVLAGADARIVSNRAYIKLSEVPGYNNPLYVAPAPAPGRKRIAMGTTGAQVATGVDQVQGGEVPTKMIINGQLFILRGEKMYDAQGKLVK